MPDFPFPAPQKQNKLARAESELRDTQARLADEQVKAAGLTGGIASPAGSAAQSDAWGIVEKNTEAMNNQTEVFKACMDKLSEKGDNQTRKRHSTIRVEPKIQWPHLGDDGYGGREVQDFYEKFEEFCNLANDGEGLADREMLIALKNCLKQSRRKIYDNVVRAHKDILETDAGP